MNEPLTFDQLRRVIAGANDQFRMIREKHPKLKGYLVFASWLGQAEIETPIEGLVEHFPAMFVENENKRLMLKEKEQRTNPRIQQGLLIASETRIEIRFKDLNYELIWRLQLDELIDRELTPQTKASIRIVLGTLADFVGEGEPRQREANAKN